MNGVMRAGSFGMRPLQYLRGRNPISAENRHALHHSFLSTRDPNQQQDATD